MYSKCLFHRKELIYFSSGSSRQKSNLSLISRKGYSFQTHWCLSEKREMPSYLWWPFLHLSWILYQWNRHTCNRVRYNCSIWWFNTSLSENASCTLPVIYLNQDVETHSLVGQTDTEHDVTFSDTKKWQLVTLLLKGRLEKLTLSCVVAIPLINCPIIWLEGE